MGSKYSSGGRGRYIDIIVWCTFDMASMNFFDDYSLVAVLVMEVVIGSIVMELLLTLHCN